MTMHIFPTTETSFMLTSPAGELEVVAASPATAAHTTAIICHPHSQFGGTMTNKVVTTLFKTFLAMGMRAVRFNFRGVGKSTGEFDNGNGESEDLRTVINWVKLISPGDSLWLAGFSFGAYVAARTAITEHPAQLILVAPAVEHFHMMALPPITSPTTVLQGEQDEIVAPQAVYDWVASREPKPTLVQFPNATHFFHGQLTELRAAVEKIISAR